MAHIIIRPVDKPGGPMELFINGVDFTNEVYRGVQLVEVGDDSYAEVGLQVTFAVSRLDLGGDEDVQVTDRFRSVAQRVRSFTEGDA